FMADLLSLSLTPLIALLLRVERPEAARPFWVGILVYIAIAVPVRVTGFYWFGLYRRYWRYATVDDLAHAVLAVLSPSLALCLLFVSWNWLPLPDIPLPRSIPFIESLLALIVVGGVRSSVRCAERALREQPGSDARHVLVFGAGGCGQMIVREMQ